MPLLRSSFRMSSLRLMAASIAMSRSSLPTLWPPSRSVTWHGPHLELKMGQMSFSKLSLSAAAVAGGVEAPPDAAPLLAGAGLEEAAPEAAAGEETGALEA